MNTWLAMSNENIQLMAHILEGAGAVMVVVGVVLMVGKLMRERKGKKEEG